MLRFENLEKLPNQRKIRTLRFNLKKSRSLKYTFVITHHSATYPCKLIYADKIERNNIPLVCKLDAK